MRVLTRARSANVLVATALAAGLAAVLLALGQSAYAGAPARTTTSDFGAEAWFNTSTCAIPGLCGSPPSYPAGTLHVGTSFGSQTAATYLAIPSSALPTGAKLTGAVLHLPVDTTSTGAGTQSPHSAALQICTTTAAITAQSGATTTPPTADCTTKVVSTLPSATSLVFSANLAPVLAQLAVRGTSLVVMPESGQALATWQLTFDSNSMSKPAVHSPSVTLTYTGGSAAASSPTTSPAASGSASASTSSSPAPAQSQDTSVPALPGGNAVIPLAAGSSIPLPSPSPVATSASPPTSTSAPASSTAVLPQAVAQILPHGFDYPVIFLLGLAIIAGLMALGRQLTRPLTVNASTARHGRP